MKKKNRQMKRVFTLYLFAIAALAAVTACQKTDTPIITDAQITVIDNLQKIRLHDGVERFELQFDCNYAWHIETSGSGFEVTPSSGAAGDGIVVTVNAPQSESVTATSQLGTMTIVVNNSTERHTIRVVRLPKIAEGGKTMIAWLFGTSLSYYLKNNIADMQTAVSKGALAGNTLITFSQDSGTKAKIQEIYLDEESGTCETTTLKAIDLSVLTTETFSEYLKTMMDLAPADNYTLMLLGHSTAWLPKTPLENTTATYGVKRGFTPSFEKMPGAAVTRHIGESNANLDMNELSEALTATGVKFDCLYFDVCFMSSLEAAYELRHTADYIIGSPCEIMGSGSPYATILQPLFESDYETVCEEYYKFYENYSYRSGCIATIDCSKLEAVADVAKRINAAPTAEGFNYSKLQTYEGRKSGLYAGHWFYDAGDYFTSICSDENLVREFNERLDECVIYRYHTTYFFSAYNNSMNLITSYSGINITPDEKCIATMPDNADRDMLEYYNPSLRQTEWYKDTH